MEGQRYHWLGLRAYEIEAQEADHLVATLGDLATAGIDVTRYQVTDGSRWLPYSRAAIESDAPDIVEHGYVSFEGDSRVQGRVSVRSRPSASVEMRGDAVDKESVRRWLHLAELWRATTRPNFLILGFAPLGPQNDGRTTWTTPTELDVKLLFKATFVGGADYWPRGPHGMGLRTYFGPPLVAMFGRERLLETPGVVTEREEGGIWIDVHEDLVDAPFDELIAAWRRCSDHLAPAEVFAPPVIDEERKRVRFKRAGANYLRPSKRS